MKTFDKVLEHVLSLPELIDDERVVRLCVAGHAAEVLRRAARPEGLTNEPAERIVKTDLLLDLEHLLLHIKEVSEATDGPTYGGIEPMLKRMRDVFEIGERTQSARLGMFACPKCGVDHPHHHDHKESFVFQLGHKILSEWTSGDKRQLLDMAEELIRREKQRQRPFVVSPQGMSHKEEQ